MGHETPGRFLGWRQVQELTGLGRTTAWRLRRTGDFPDPVVLSPGRVAWRERDIAAWNESRDTAACARARSPRPRTSSPSRTPEAHFLPETTGSTTAPETPSTARPAPETHRSRHRSAHVAEGQFGFDF